MLDRTIQIGSFVLSGIIDLSTLCGVWSVVIFCKAFLKCSTGRGMDKKMGPKLRDLAPWPRVRGIMQPRTSMYRAQSRLREIVPSARGNQDVGSCNLGPTFLNDPVCNVWRIGCYQGDPDRAKKPHFLHDPFAAIFNLRVTPQFKLLAGI